jgi:hypothetical protein
MPRIVVESDAPAGEAGHVTLAERVVADNLRSDHYADQLLERLCWAVADAEARGPQDRRQADDDSSTNGDAIVPRQAVGARRARAAAVPQGAGSR